MARQLVKFLTDRHRKAMRSAWAQDQAVRPLRILIVAYKNLSLDHLCRACLPFLPNGKHDIVRLGRKSRSEALTNQDEAKAMYEHHQEYSRFRLGEVALGEGPRAHLGHASTVRWWLSALTARW